MNQPLINKLAAACAEFDKNLSENAEDNTFLVAYNDTWDAYQAMLGECPTCDPGDPGPPPPPA